MIEKKTVRNVDQNAISLYEIAQLINASYKKILLLAFACLVIANIFTYAFGQYTATIMRLNFIEFDIQRIKYLQAALPKLSQEEHGKIQENYLNSEMLWKSSIAVKSLIGKSDVKDLIDPASLKSERINNYALEFIGIGNSKQLAVERANQISNYFISGTVFIALRDLMRMYELNIANTNHKLTSKILNAEAELSYLDSRIKNLTELKKQYPAGAPGQNSSVQLIDANDNGAKYLPILTQIIAAKADRYNQNELLFRYKEENAQMLVYASFLEKAKSIMGGGSKDPKLITNLLYAVAQASKEVNTNYEKAAWVTIEADLIKIMSLQLHGLPQIGIANTIGPAYLKNSVIGFFSGGMIGIFLALGFLVAQRLRVEMKSWE
jgi:hypothetical protein